MWIKLRHYRLKVLKYYSSLLLRLVCWAKNVELGRECVAFGLPLFVLAPNSRIIIGHGVVFRSDRTSNLIGVNHRCMISTLSPGAEIRIGDNSGFSGVVIGCGEKIQIGAQVLCGANVVITDTDWHNVNPSLRQMSRLEPAEPVYIADNVFIGANVYILKGVRIGQNSVIGAGSVVTKSIPDNVIAAGNPCRVIKSL